MIRFMYGHKYDGDSSGGHSPMLFAAKVFGVAEKYGVDALRNFAEDKFEKVVSNCWDMDDLPSAVTEVYTEIPPVNGGLRRILAEVSSKHIKELLKKGEFQYILANIPEFAADIIPFLDSKSAPPPVVTYSCPSCESRWKTDRLSENHPYYCQVCGQCYENWDDSIVR